MKLAYKTKTNSMLGFLVLLIIILVCSSASAEYDPPHNSASSVFCGGCHGRTLAIPGGSPFWTDNSSDSAYNAVCLRCHCTTESEAVGVGYIANSAPIVSSHELGSTVLRCTACHNNHEQDQIFPGKYDQANFFIATATGDSLDSYDEGSRTTTIHYSGLTGKGDWADSGLENLDAKTIEYRGAMLVPDTTARSRWSVFMIADIDTSNSTITVKGDLGTAPNIGIFYGQSIRSWIEVDSLINMIEFFDPTGEKGFVRSNPPYGLCQICHDSSVLSYWTNDGSGTDHNPDRNCMDCHKHTNGFVHGGGGGSGNCSECHGHDEGSPYDEDMAGDGPFIGFSLGAGTFQSHSTHTESDDDDANGPDIYCNTCHDTANMPRFKKLDGSGNHTLAETDICNNCHSRQGTYDGVNDPVIGAKQAWDTGVYEATDDKILQSGKEKWCAGCHDEVPSNSKVDGSGVDAPNIVGDEDGAYTYGTGWGFYKTGHGVPASESYPASGGVTTGAGAHCFNCHNPGAAHIDHTYRTFDDGDSRTTDPSVYRQGYRLRQVTSGTGVGENGREPMLVPWPQNVSNAASNYALCMECHDAGPFTDSNNTDTNLKTNGVNRHEAHLVMNSYRYQSDWSGAGTCLNSDSSGCNSLITCVTCHTVHGSTRLAMVRDGSLISQDPAVSREPGLMIWYHDDPTAPYNNGDEETVTWSETNTSPPTPEDLPLSASTGTVWRGNTSDNLCTHCHQNDNTTGEYRAPYQTGTQQAPILSWTGESGYETDGSDPDSAVTESSFTFRVKYTDTNNDPPTFIQLRIDKNSNDSFADSGETVALSPADGDSVYHDGKIYTADVTLDNIGGNIKKYYFEASDGAAATGEPTFQSSVYVFASSSGMGTAPVLDWTGQANYSTDGVNPDSGSSGSSFEFRVKYSDADNDAPALMQVWIDEDRNGAFSSSEKYGLTEDGGGADYIAGKYFILSNKTLTCAGGCTMEYRFYASDGTNEATTGDPVSTSTVTVMNNTPSLSWTAETNYTTDGVDPDSGTGGSTFEFRVKYSDPDNSAPSTIQVWIDTDDSGDYSAHEKHDMAEYGGGADYTEGRFFNYSMTLPYVGDGKIDFRFYASDGVDDGTGVSTISKQLNINNPSATAPILSWVTADCMTDGVRPATGAEGVEFQFKVNYTGTQCPSEILLWIDEDDDNAYDADEKYTLTGLGEETECPTGRLYEKNQNLSVSGDGTYKYRFFATDGVVAATGSPTGDSSVTVLYALKVRPTGGDGWYSTIQGALNATTEYAFDSTDRGTVLVYPDSDFTAATYTENVSMATGSRSYHNLTIQSACGPDYTAVKSSSGSNTILIQDCNNPVIDGFSITGSSNASTAGIYLNRDYNFGTGTSFTFRNNKIFANDHGFYLNDSNSTPVLIENSLIYSNNTRALLSQADVVISISDSEIFNHDSTGVGGALYLNGTNSTTIERSVVRDNTTTGEGGAIYLNANNGTGDVLNLTNVIFAGNQGSNGGVIRTNGGPAVNVSNSTIADNQGSKGGVFYICGTGTTTIKNSIFRNNSSADGKGDNVYKVCGSGEIGSIDYSDIDTTSPGGIFNATYTGNVGNQNVDPLFTWDYHLQAGSPVIDQALASAGPSDDIDGETRTAVSGMIDMGADEYVAAGANSTVAGQATAYAASTTSINYSMPYTGDANSDNTYTVDYKLSTDATWTNWVTGAAHAASPYASAITGLTAYETYDVRVTYVDADNVYQTNPQIITYILMDDRTTIGVATAEAASDSSIDVSMPYTGDPDGDNTYTVEYCVSSSCSWTDWVRDAAHSASPYNTTITGLTPEETYDVRMTYNDADGYINPAEQVQTVTSITLPPAGVPVGVVNYWRFDEGSGVTAADSVGSSNGTITDATWDVGLGVNDDVLSYDNTADNVLASGVTWQPTSFSVEFWIYPLSCASWNQPVGAVNSWGAFSFHTQVGCALYVGTNTGGGRFYLGNGTLSMNTWQHFVYTNDGSGNARFYKNGVEIAASSSQGTSIEGWGGFRIGSTGSNSVHGRVDEVVIYDRALTGTEVQERYEYYPVMNSLTASDASSGGGGIQAGDKVEILYSVGTNAPVINAGNIDTVLALNNGHSWLDGNGAIGSASWSTTTSVNDTLTVTLSAGTSAPTVAPGDTVTLDGATIKDGSDTPITHANYIDGSF